MSTTPNSSEGECDGLKQDLWRQTLCSPLDTCSTSSTTEGTQAQTHKSLQYKTLHLRDSKGCFFSPTLTDRRLKNIIRSTELFESLNLKKHIGAGHAIIWFDRALRRRWHRELLIVKIKNKIKQNKNHNFLHSIHQEKLTQSQLPNPAGFCRFHDFYVNPWA